jgi:hypothetical protein
MLHPATNAYSIKMGAEAPRGILSIETYFVASARMAQKSEARWGLVR